MAVSYERGTPVATTRRDLARLLGTRCDWVQVLRNPPFHNKGSNSSLELLQFLLGIGRIRASAAAPGSLGKPHPTVAQPGAGTTREPWRGFPKVNLPARQWFSEVKIALKGAFERSYPLQHSGVACQGPCARLHVQACEWTCRQPCVGPCMHGTARAVVSTPVPSLDCASVTSGFAITCVRQVSSVDGGGPDLDPPATTPRSKGYVTHKHTPPP